MNSFEKGLKLLIRRDAELFFPNKTDKEYDEITQYVFTGHLQDATNHNMSIQEWISYLIYKDKKEEEYEKQLNTNNE